MLPKQLNLCQGAASTHWDNKTSQDGGEESRDHLCEEPLSQPAAHLCSPPYHHTLILPQTARPPRHKLLCWRLHQPCLEKSLNPQARVSSNPSGAAGLQHCPIPLSPGPGLSRDGAQLRTRCQDRTMLPSSSHRCCSSARQEQPGWFTTRTPLPHRPEGLTHTTALGQFCSGMGSQRCSHGEMLGRGWECSPPPWQEQGEHTSVPPAARPGICSLLRQTAAERP